MKMSVRFFLFLLQLLQNFLEYLGTFAYFLSDKLAIILINQPEQIDNWEPTTREPYIQPRPVFQSEKLYDQSIIYIRNLKCEDRFTFLDCIGDKSRQLLDPVDLGLVGFLKIY
jgi:hypothetical protein